MVQGQENDGTVDEYSVCDLIREDWRDMVSTFFFPKMTKMLSDEKIRTWIESTNKELLEDNQEVGQIKNIV